MQERFLEIFLVDSPRVDAKHHEHLAGIAYRKAVHHLSAAFASN